MGCKSDAVGGTRAIAQEALQNSQRELALGARTLVDRSCNRAGSEMGHQSGKQIGGDHRDLPFFSLPLESAQHGHGVGGRDVAAHQTGMIPKDAQGLVKGFSRSIMGFNRGQHFQMCVMPRDSLAEALYLFHVISGRELAGKNCHLAPFAQEATHEIADQAAAGPSVDGNGGNAIGTGSVGDDTNDGNVPSQRLADAAEKLTGVADGGYDAVHGRFERIVEGLHFPHTQTREAAELEIDRALGQDHVLGFDSRADMIEKRSNLLREVHGDAKPPLGRQHTGGEIGPIAHGLGHLLDAPLGDGVDSRSVVESAVHGADGDFQSFGNVNQPDHASPF